MNELHPDAVPTPEGGAAEAPAVALADREIQRITDGEPNGMVGLVDAAHNMICVWGVNVAQTNDSYIRVRRYNPAGVPTGEWRQEIGTDQKKSKLSGVSIMASGADLWVGYWGHNTIYTVEPRHGFVRFAIFPGIVVPRADGRDLVPLGESYDASVLPEVGGGSPPEPGVDPAVLAAAVVDAIKAQMGGELGALVQARAKNGARQALQFEVGAALTALSAQPAFLQGLRDGMYQWQLDRAFQGAQEALKKAGLPPKE